MTTLLENGGSILSMAGEGGEDNMKTNINYFLEDFGISVNTGKIINPVSYTHLTLPTILLV